MTKSAGIALTVVMVLIVATGALRLVTRDRPTPLARSASILGDGAHFTTSRAAGQALADVSTILRLDGVSCQQRHGRSDRRCAATLQAAAFTAVDAYTVVDCTAPGVYRARASLISYVGALRTFVDGAGWESANSPLPKLPRVVTC